MKNLVLIACIALKSNLFGQWKQNFPSKIDTFNVGHICLNGLKSVIAAGQKFNVQDLDLGYPEADSIFIYNTEDSGETWTSMPVFFGNKAFITSMSAPTSDIWYISGYTNLLNAKLIKTTNHGLNWIDITPPLNPVMSFINMVHFYDESLGITLCDPEGGEFIIYHTLNGGETWTSLSNSLIPDAYLGEFGIRGEVLGDCIWFTTNYGRIFKSMDKGFHWEAVQTIINNLEQVSFSDTLNGVGRYGFVALDFNTTPVIITADGGKTWKLLDITPLGPKTGIFGASYIPNSSYIMLTTAKNSLLTGDFATWISPDRGETWQQISSGEKIYTIDFLDAATGWGGEWQQFNHPTRMFQYTGSPLVGLFSDKVLQVDWDVFPNPTADRVQVRVQEDKPASYLLLVNDLQGKLILRQDWDGTGMLDLDLGACANGMYTVTLASKEGKAVQKLVVAR